MGGSWRLGTENPPDWQEPETGGRASFAVSTYNSEQYLDTIAALRR